MRILITAGPTREFLDPVRYISNRSSGRMGYALAASARDRGHEVTLVSGPVALPAPARVRVVAVVSAADMQAAVERELEASEALVMAAAVADWRPAVVQPGKVKKLGAAGALTLEPTADILCAIRPRKGGRVFVGFAAETGDPEPEARRKLAAKGLDLIVANDVTQPDAGFDVETNRVTLFDDGGGREVLPVMSKRDVADRLIQWVERRAGVVVEPRVAPSPDEAFAGVEDRLVRQMEFIGEVDKLKSVYRRTLLMDGTRYENDAEHSWHLALMAVLLREWANEPALDVGRVIRMVLVHDLVEIDAGDTYCYDERGNLDKPRREALAADRIFALLPADQGAALRALWEEFEARQTPEACFAAALDRVQPLLHNYRTGGVIWDKHGIDCRQVRERNRHVEEGSKALWAYAEAIITEAVRKGCLKS
jgi:putative hydrolase of HD superfamily